MSGELRITVIGNLTSDPNLNFTGGGVPVANFTIASTPRDFDRQSGQMVKGDASFVRCVVWREFAENISKSLSKGMRVIAYGRFHQRKYRDTATGDDRTVWELEIEAIGPDLRWATAKVERAGSSASQTPFAGAAYEPQEPTGWDEQGL